MTAKEDDRFPPGYRIPSGTKVASVQLAPPLSMAIKVWKRDENDEQRYLLIDQDGGSTGYTVTLEDIKRLRERMPQG